MRKLIRFFQQNSRFTTRSALENNEDVYILQVIRVVQ
jgi:hypothetical protein